MEDVTGAVIDQLETLYRENPPELVYFLTLYHLFRDYMADQEDPIRPGLDFEKSVVWNKLYDFQRDAVVGAIRKLEKYKGCIIADSVGLGKTFEALAVIKYYEERNAPVLVLCPKRLRENWTLYTRDNDDRNPLAEDRFAYTVLNHTDLSRYRGMSGDVDLGHLRWGNYDPLVIDESHNFRNKSTDADKKDRYTRLARANLPAATLMASIATSYIEVGQYGWLGNQLAYLRVLAHDDWGSSNTFAGEPVQTMLPPSFPALVPRSIT